MYDEEDTTEEETREDKTCQKCGLRQYNDICANCDTPIEEEEKKKGDDLDEYDWRERR